MSCFNTAADDNDHLDVLFQSAIILRRQKSNIVKASNEMLYHISTQTLVELVDRRSVSRQSFEVLALLSRSK